MKKFLSLVLVTLLVGGAVLWVMGMAKSKVTRTPPEILGGPVRITDDQGDRLYYLTSQWEKRITRAGGSRYSSNWRTTNWLFIDLWAINPTTAQPIFRKRLKKDKVNADSTAMGVEQGVLWARIPELIGIRLEDGAIVADSGKIEIRNPSLKGLMPNPAQGGTFLPEMMQPLKFDPDVGMVVRLDDARQVRIDPLTLEASPHVPLSEEEKSKANAAKGSDRAKVERMSNGMEWRAMARSVVTQGADKDMDWMGLLSETELKQALERKVAGSQMDFTVPMHHRLYRARLTPGDPVFGMALEFRDAEPLPEGPEFLMGGLLTQNAPAWGERPALWRREPDSVFVISRDRLGDEGRMQVARIADPAGRTVWSAPLPLSAMSGWLPGERHALMFGAAPSARRSPEAEENENPVMHIVSLDLETGEVKTFNPDEHRDWPAEDLTETKP